MAGRSHTARGRRGLIRLVRLMGLLLSYSLIRADVGCQDLEANIVQVFISGQGGYATPTGEEDHPHPNPLPSEGEGVGHAPPDPAGIS